MGRIKIDYGIDLGTTNSAIARIENGDARIIKTDTQNDIMPSCVNYDKKKNIKVGALGYNALKSDRLKAWKTRKLDSLNAFIEFKRTMGTDTEYFSSNMEKFFSSEELSAEVLKMLKSFVIDENIDSAVITIPAKFTMNQKDATAKAAKMAGFKQYELLQEPIAASIAYGLSSKRTDGYWMVFDFGGGTFDAAILRVEDGIMKVIDTEGDNHLGGKNLDYEIVENIILPYIRNNYNIEKLNNFDIDSNLLREALKYFAEEVKAQLSFKEKHNILTDLGELGFDDDGNEIELDISVTHADMIRVLSPTYQKAVTICLDLLKRNNLTGSSLETIILVGGPTYSPVLRSMLKEQITTKIDTSIDPMTAVAKGAAIYASTISINEEIIDETRDDDKVQITLGYASSTVENTELVTIKLNSEKNKINIQFPIFTEFVRSDKSWSSGRKQLDTNGELIEVDLNENTTNSFEVIIYDKSGNRIPSEPNQFTILQGSIPGNAVLPYHFGIIVHHSDLEEDGFKPILGLEKNKPLPAKGIENSLKTQKTIRPGVKEDFIKIPLYEGDNIAEGSRAELNEHVYDFVISGEDLPKLLPEGSNLELTFTINRNGEVFLKVFLPLLEHTFEAYLDKNNRQKETTSDKLFSDISNAKLLSEELINSTVSDKSQIENISSEVNNLEYLLKQSPNDSDRKKQVLNELRKQLMLLYKCQKNSEWPKLEEQLKNKYYEAERLFAQFEGKLEGLNEDRIKEMLLNSKSQIPTIIKEKNIKLTKDLISQLEYLNFTMIDIGYGAQLEISLVKGFHDDFDLHDWSDEKKALLLINQAIKIINNNPTKEQLRPIVSELYSLLPSKQRPLNDLGLLKK